ncbi:MAG: hypothetical protein KGN79_03365 [Acidobacteriota bacterium]|nr:hypothetical protein [Acidobacteriota bacterium]
MNLNYTVALCLIGSVSNLYVGLQLRRFKVPQTAPRSRAHLTREERQERIKIAERIAYGLSALLLAAAAVFSWLGF